MRKIQLLLLLIVIFSCSQKHPDNRIVKFEKVLGERNLKALNLLVNDFENNLAEIYPDLSIEKGYKRYLRDLIADSITDGKKFDFQSEKTNKEFHQSGFYNEVYEVRYFQKPDSKDSIRSLEVNKIGKYMQALYGIKDSDSLIKKYWDKREAAGLMQNELVVNGLLSSKPDFNDYFHKLIVVVEFSF